jgi:hypothetical protein
MKIKYKNLKHAQQKFKCNFILITYGNINMKWTKLWFKIAPQINVEEIEGNGGPTFI